MKRRFNVIQFTAFAFIFTFLLFTSCQKENSKAGTDDEQEAEASLASSQADGESELVYNGVFDDVIGVNDEVGIGGTGIFGRVASCPDVTIVHLNAPAQFPIQVTLNFGNAGCVGNDGHMRRGIIRTVYTNRLLVPGAMATTTFDGFYFDTIHVQGTHRITNSSPTTQPPSRQFTVDVLDGKLTRPSGNYIEWNSHKVITQIEGLATAIPLDDIFRIEGNAHGKVKRGALIVLWESAVTEPLIKRFNCHWIVRGRIRTVRGTLATTSPWVAVLDFGAGTCDNQAIITINGVPHQITLP